MFSRKSVIERRLLLIPMFLGSIVACEDISKGFVDSGISLFYLIIMEFILSQFSIGKKLYLFVVVLLILIGITGFVWWILCEAWMPALIALVGMVIVGLDCILTFKSQKKTGL